MLFWILIAGPTPPPEGYRPLKLAGRRLLVSPRAEAREAAALLYPDAPAEAEALLDELPARGRSGLLRLLPPRPADGKAAAARADALLDALSADGRDCVLVTQPLFAAVLTDRARLRGCVSQRSGLGALRPWERILVSSRGAHCGGCEHNCLLSNPGCPVGRDKAARQK